MRHFKIKITENHKVCESNVLSTYFLCDEKFSYYISMNF